MAKNMYFLCHFHLNFLSLKLRATGDKPLWVLAMEQNDSMQKSFGESVAKEHREKSNKCNLCDHATSNAGHLRTHLKMHSGEKSNNCNQCVFASSRAGNLRTHMLYKNTGILFSKIPVSVFESDPGIPVFSGIPQGPAPLWSRL